MERYRVLFTKLNSKTTANNYLFLGNNIYEKDKAVLLLKKIILPGEESQLSYEILYADELDELTLVDKISNLPFFSSSKVIVIKDIDELKDDAKDALIKYLENPSKAIHLVLYSNEYKVQTVFYKNLDRLTECYSFSDYDNEIFLWIKNHAKTLGKEIEGEAIKLLQEKNGSDMQALSNEIEKLAVFVNERNIIKENDVMSLSGEFVSGSIFNLVDAVGRKDANQSLRFLNTILVQGESPIYVLNMMLRQFKLLWNIKSLMNKNMSPFDISKKLFLHERVVQNLLNQQKYFKLQDMPGIFNKLLMLDLDMKSSSHPHLSLEMFIFDIAAS